MANYAERLIFWLIPKPRFDDHVDFLHFYVTTSIIALLSTVVSAKLYWGTPLTCFTKPDWTHSQEAYATDFCAAEGTYYVPMNETIPKNSFERYKFSVYYYQYVPAVLALHSICFFLPVFLWRRLTKNHVLDIHKVVEGATKGKNMTRELRKYLTKDLADFIWERFNLQEEPNLCGCWNAIWKKNRIFIMYSFLKMVNLINAPAQIVIMGFYLDISSAFWGFQIISDIYYGKHWRVTGTFPRVTYCDVEFRGVDSSRTSTIQCILLVNMINEKIYIFLWFWLTSLMVLSFINLFIFFADSAIPQKRAWKLKRFLKETNNNSNTRQFDFFVKNGLQLDGYLLLSVVEHKAGSLVMRELTKALFQCYQKSRSDFVEIDAENGTERDPPQHNHDTEAPPTDESQSHDHQARMEAVELLPRRNFEEQVQLNEQPLEDESEL